MNCKVSFFFLLGFRFSEFVFCLLVFFFFWKRVFRNYDPSIRNLENATEYVRAVNAAKLDKVKMRFFLLEVFW